MDAKTKMFRNPRAFTLIEMLIVIVIIGMLASLITAAAVAALRAAKRFAITNEISQLTMALEKYRQEHGDYPPDFAGLQSSSPAQVLAAQEAVLRHLRKAYPRYALTGNTDAKWTQFRLNVKQASTADASLKNADSPNGLEVNYLDPSSALAFWLGGPRDLSTTGTGSTKLVGFSANPANPFAIGGSRLPVLFEFDETRLADDATLKTCKYIPSNMPTTPMAGETKAPYVYFRADPGAAAKWAYNPLVACFPQPNVPTGLDTGTCVPYANQGSVDSGGGVRTDAWFNPKTFQIISAGLDGEFSEPTDGRPGYIPPDSTTLDEKGRFLAGADNNLSSPEDDNLTNFTKGTLADEVK